jgi:hypothetical protein
VGAPLGVVDGETLPHGEVVQETVHVTPLESFVTVAVNCAVAPTSTVALALDKETLMAGWLDPLPQPVLAAETRTATPIATRTRWLGDI